MTPLQARVTGLPLSDAIRCLERGNAIGERRASKIMWDKRCAFIASQHAGATRR